MRVLESNIGVRFRFGTRVQSGPKKKIAGTKKFFLAEVERGAWATMQTNRPTQTDETDVGHGKCSVNAQLPKTTAHHSAALLLLTAAVVVLFVPQA